MAVLHVHGCGLGWRSFVVICKSTSANRSGVAASRFAAAVCIILWSFAAERRKSYWTGCIKVAAVICQQTHLHFGFEDSL